MNTNVQVFSLKYFKINLDHDDFKVETCNVSLFSGLDKKQISYYTMVTTSPEGIHSCFDNNKTTFLE
jgi:hypothetical protein